MDKDQYLAEVESRLRRMFSASKSGYKTPAVDRHRLEGFMQAGVFFGLTDNRELTQLMEETHFSVFGKTIRERREDNPLNWQSEPVDYRAYEAPTFIRNGEPGME